MEEGSETAVETVPGDDDPAEQSILKAQLQLIPYGHLHTLSSPRFLYQRHPARDFRYTDPGTHSSGCLSRGLSDAPSARHHHMGLEPKLYRYHPNVRRTRQEKTGAPKPDSYISDTEEDYANALDNCPRDLGNVDSGNWSTSEQRVHHHTLFMFTTPRHQTRQMGIRCPNIRFRRSPARLEVRNSSILSWGGSLSCHEFESNGNNSE